MHHKTLLLFLKYLSIFTWLILLLNTDSFFVVYLLIGIAATIIIGKGTQSKQDRSWLSYAFAAFYSIAVTLANYSIFVHEAEQGGIHIFTAIISVILMLTCGFIVFLNILPLFRTAYIKISKEKPTPTKTFLICFFIFSIIDLTVLFLCCYPGSLTPDSINEVGQILSGQYTNHHPFYYTILIHPFISIGINLFNDINVGVALFNVFQILILSTAFSYSISTLQRIGISKKILYPLCIVLALLPYNIIYSFTIWKDILFGAFFLILIVTLYRYFNNINPYKKSRIIQLFIIFLSSIAVCLFRSNALIAFFVSTVLFFILFKKRYVQLGIILMLAVTTSFILKRPVLQQIDVKQTDIIESLSIPSQQIVKTIKYKKDQLSEDDKALINSIANIDDLINAYIPTIHDPVKKVIRNFDNQDYLKEHAIDYITLYIRLGAKYPLYYLSAWIDQTRGYWNGGYSYWIWRNEIHTNDYGIKRRPDNFFSKIFNSYLDNFQKMPIFYPLISIGLTVWLIIALLYKSLVSKNKVVFFLILLVLAPWATLLIATPVFSEFRYVYFMFTTAPFLTIISCLKPPKIAKIQKRSIKNEKS